MIVEQPATGSSTVVFTFWMVAIAVTVVAAPMAGAEPVVKETRQGGTSVIRITPTQGTEKSCRIDLSQRHAPASEQNALLKTWESLRLGAFVCFNTNQFSGIEICRASDPKAYNAEQLDVAGWVAAFRSAGVKYAVLTTRHTSGFLLWDSATTDFDVASSGNTTDVCGEFVKECRTQGLAPAFYYCLWGGKWKPDANARAVILAQLYELATAYGEISYFWLDMMNWSPPDLTAQEIYDALKTLQPNALDNLNSVTARPVLIGTWAAATWAVRFYEKHGFRLVTPEEKNRLLKKYWSIPERQVETSVVLGDERWFGYPGRPSAARRRLCPWVGTRSGGFGR